MHGHDPSNVGLCPGVDVCLENGHLGVKGQGASAYSSGSYLQGPCTEIYFGLKVVPISAPWGQSMYYMDYMGTRFLSKPLYGKGTVFPTIRF